MTSLNQLIQRRQVQREAVDAHKERMVAETQAWRVRELREQSGIALDERAQHPEALQD